MTEIKSTLDIIMEKAKKLSVTEEEKRGFKRQELQGKIKGLVQKAIDGVLDSERFQSEVASLRTKDKDLVDPILKEELVGRLGVEANSEALLMMMENVAGTSSPALERVLAEFKMTAEGQRESRRKALLDIFKKKGVSGSAVLPNLDADPEWLRTKTEMRRKLQEEVRKQLKSLSTSLQ